MTKKILMLVVLLATSFGAMAQRYYREGERGRDREPAVENPDEFTGGFKKEHVFIGGNLGLGFSSYSFNAGLSPEIGYSVSSWLDAGVLINLNYNSFRDPYSDTRNRSFNYGAGIFAKAYPLPFLFLQVSPEYNWIHYSEKSLASGLTGSLTTNAPSLLVGVGYGQRVVGHSNFHLALLFDVLNRPQSPYTDGYGRITPVIKAGFDFYLKPRKQNPNL